MIRSQHTRLRVSPLGIPETVNLTALYVLLYTNPVGQVHGFALLSCINIFPFQTNKKSSTATPPSPRSKWLA